MEAGGGALEDAAAVLEAVAEERLAAGATADGVRCLEAIFAPDAPPPLPLAELRLRVRLAGLHMQHTDDAAELERGAKAHLERAQVLARKLPREDALKCALHAELARCYRMLGLGRRERGALDKGLEVARRAAAATAAAQPPRSAEFERWALTFLLHKAEVLRRAGAADGAVSTLRDGLEVAERLDDADAVVVCAIGGAVLRIPSGDAVQLGAALAAADAAIERYQKSQPEDAPSRPHLLLLHRLLHALVSLRDGALSAARTHASELGGLLQRCAGTECPYVWLPLPAVEVLARFVQGVVCRPSGQFKQAREHFDAVLKMCHTELRALGVGGDTAEAEVPPRIAGDCTLYVRSAFHALENLALISLTECDIMQAQTLLAQAAALMGKFPNALQHLGLHLHLVIGMYAQATRQYPAARTHLSLARREGADPKLQTLATVQLALCLLAQAGPDAFSQALELLSPISRALETLGTLEERTMALFISGLMHHKQGNTADAKARLSRSLKVAHTDLCNHQLVAQTLNLLGALALDGGDTAQATDMLRSAYTLSKSLHDMNTQLGSLTSLARLSRAKGDAEEESTNVDLKSRKLNTLNVAVQAATETDANAAILGSRFAQAAAGEGP